MPAFGRAHAHTHECINAILIRFAMYEVFAQSEQLTYPMFLENTNVSQYDPSTLLTSARDCFKLSKSYTDRLLHRDFEAHAGRWRVGQWRGLDLCAAWEVGHMSLTVVHSHACASQILTCHLTRRRTRARSSSLR